MAKKKAKSGRPSLYSVALSLKICERLAEGESLRSICRCAGMPAQSTIFRWLEEYQPFRELYARAREAQADTLADEIVDIADDGKRDYIKDKDGREIVDHDHIARARLRVDARKWIASKLKPKKYGEKLEQTHQGPNGESLIPPVINIGFANGGPGTSPEGS